MSMPKRANKEDQDQRHARAPVQLALPLARAPREIGHDGDAGKGGDEPWAKKNRAHRMMGMSRRGFLLLFSLLVIAFLVAAWVVQRAVVMT